MVKEEIIIEIGKYLELNDSETIINLWDAAQN